MSRTAALAAAAAALLAVPLPATSAAAAALLAVPLPATSAAADPAGPGRIPAPPPAPAA
jgi:hypothetical protein